jgi:hypothetical protein
MPSKLTDSVSSTVGRRSSFSSVVSTGATLVFVALLLAYFWTFLNLEDAQGTGTRHASKLDIHVVLVRAAFLAILGTFFLILGKVISRLVRSFRKRSNVSKA